MKYFNFGHERLFFIELPFSFGRILILSLSPASNLRVGGRVCLSLSHLSPFFVVYTSCLLFSFFFPFFLIFFSPLEKLLLLLTNQLCVMCVLERYEIVTRSDECSSTEIATSALRFSQVIVSDRNMCRKKKNAPS